MFRPSTGLVYWRLTLTSGIADVSFIWGNPGDGLFTGDWNSNGVDTQGLYRPSNEMFFLRNSNTAGVADFEFFLGDSSWMPVAGDWGLG